MSAFARIGACALAVLIALPAAAYGAPRSGGGERARPAAPAQRSAPAARPAGGFDFGHDIGARPAAPAPARPQPQVQPQQPRPGLPQRPVVSRRPPAPQRANARRFTGPVVRNPHAPSGNWGWNRGVVWQPAPVYWGGGFWGPYALASLAGALLFGSIVDDQDQYASYQVEPGTPGADLLADYGLRQTVCGQANLVVIWGPDNSVVCAYPNAAVGPGDYEVDPSTFTLVPASS